MVKLGKCLFVVFFFGFFIVCSVSCVWFLMVEVIDLGVVVCREDLL